MTISSILIAVSAVAVAALAGLITVVSRSRRQRRVEMIMQEAAVEVAAATSRESLVAAVRRAVGQLVPSRAQPQVDVVSAEEAAASSALGEPGALVPISASRTAGPAPVGALLVDPATASHGTASGALRALSAQAALAVERLQLADQLAMRSGVSHLGTLVEQTADVVLIVDGDNRIRFASPSARTVLGTAPLMDLPLLDLLEATYQRPADYLLRHARDASGSPEHPSRADWMIESPDGRQVYVEVSCRPLGPTPPHDSLLLTLRDVTAQRRLEQELTRRVFYDPLTGLANRRLFVDRLRQRLSHGSGTTGVVVVCTDNLKSINDAFGHAAGDTVLTRVGRLIRDTVGPEGVVARLGDDEFGALLPDLTAPEEVVARLVDNLERPISAGDVRLASAASVGVATAATARNARELLQQAYLALGAAKAAGSGHWRRYEPSMSDAAVDRIELRAELSQAASNGSLGLEYQPIVALDSGATIGLEALVRWRHPSRGWLHPAEFIDFAEESGLIVQIGEWVLATAMAQATRWGNVEGPDATPYLSVNVSPQQFRAGGFVGTVDRLLRTTGLAPGRLVLEITESLLLDDADPAWSDLQQLRERGIRVALDDFGTGYSGLGYLRHAPFDVVKLDRLFTGPLAASARQRDLVTGIARLARSLDLDVVAEGIETSYQRDVAAQIGIRYGQGYLFGRPANDPSRFLPRPLEHVRQRAQPAATS